MPKDSTTQKRLPQPVEITENYEKMNKKSGKRFPPSTFSFFMNDKEYVSRPESGNSEEYSPFGYNSTSKKRGYIFFVKE